MAPKKNKEPPNWGLGGGYRWLVEVPEVDSARLCGEQEEDGGEAVPVDRQEYENDGDRHVDLEYRHGGALKPVPLQPLAGLHVGELSAPEWPQPVDVSD